MFDIIGDIHGHADKLIELLQKLNYQVRNGAYFHPERKALFVGDYIDRGPKIKETLSIVKNMVDAGNAIALMGNHEFNAICFHYPEKEGGHVRKHLIKNVLQHYETLRQFQNKQTEYDSYIDWCLTLPLYFENDGVRAVHASWIYPHIDLLKKTLVNDRLTEELIYEAAKTGSPLNIAVEETLKGKEIKMPHGLHFTDKDGHVRNEIRIKWWEDPNQSTYKTISLATLDQLPELPVEGIEAWQFYGTDEKPVFFGHYWLTGQPKLYRSNICCLDYSVAKGGYLVAYKWDGESELSANKFEWIEPTVEEDSFSDSTLGQ